MSSYLRPLFKIGYQTLKGARNIPKDLGPATRQVYENNPYIQKYMNIALGKEGLTKQTAVLGGTGYAYDKFKELLLPERVEEDTVIDPAKSGIAESGGSPFSYETVKKPKIISATKIEKEDTNKEVTKLEKEESIDREGTTNNKVATNTASLNATNSDATESIGSDAVTRVKAYKDIIRQFLGSGEESERMQKSALLMSVGGMLMAGRSDEPGMRGFVDIIGQTAVQTAPMLFKMGMEQGKAEREIGQAALQLYMENMNDSDRSGDIVAVWRNEYERDGKGNIKYDKFSGAPIVKGRNLVSQFRENSDEMNWFFDQNNVAGYPLYTFQKSTGTQAGLMGISSRGEGGITLESSSGRDAMSKFATYVQRGLIPLAKTILPMMMQNREQLGASGWFGRNVGPTAFLANQLVTGLKEGFGENSITQLNDEDYKVNPNSELGKFYKQILGEGPEGMEYDNAHPDGMSFAVNENPTAGQFIDLPGVGNVPVFVDKEGKYGTAGASYMTKGALRKILFDPRKGQLKIFETTLGLMLARNRQPTGRMLADVLRRSFEETSMTGLFTLTNDPAVVIGNYINIYNELYNNMSMALNLSGWVISEEQRKRGDQKVSEEAFTIPGASEMADVYYQLRTEDPRYSEAGYDIQGPGILQFKDWIPGNSNTIIQDNQQTNITLDGVFDKWDKIFE